MSKRERAYFMSIFMYFWVFEMFTNEFESCHNVPVHFFALRRILAQMIDFLHVVTMLSPLIHNTLMKNLINIRFFIAELSKNLRIFLRFFGVYKVLKVMTIGVLILRSE